MRYLVILEQGDRSWGVHVPDIPGCVAVAETKDEALRLIGEAVDLHLDELRRSGDPLPRPCSESAFVETSVA
jgi:predicted RNase H-like HicB family nuclease